MWIFPHLPDHALCIAKICLSFLRPPELSLYIVGLVCTCLGSPSPPSMLQGLCSLVLAHWPTLYIVGLICTDLGSPGPPSALQGLCALISAPWAALCITGVVCTCLGSPTCPLCLRACVFFFWLPGPTLCIPRLVCTAEVCMPHISQHPQACLLCSVGCVLWRALYAAWLSATQAFPLHCNGCVHWRGLFVKGCC